LIPPFLQKGLGAELGGVFYLHGADTYRREEAVQALVRAHLDPATEAFNFDPLRGGEIEPELLASVLGTPPMMADWRVVVLREVEALASSARARDLLLEGVKHPPAGLALILSCTVPDRTSAKFYTDLARLSRTQEFKVLGPDDVPGWLIDRAEGHLGRAIEEGAARALAQAVGADLAYLSMELDKLHALAGPEGPITEDHVRAAGTRIPRQDRWEWFDRAGEGRWPEVLEGLEILLQHGETPVGLTLGLATHLLRLGVALEGGGGALEALLPPHQKWLHRRYAAQARRWSSADLEVAVQELLQVDRLLKAASFSDAHLLESWILTRMAGSASGATRTMSP
jgi:DNA polymerase III subunit delta